MTDTMTWEQKWQAIKAFSGECKPIMRKPYEWYVQTGMDVGGDGFLTGSYGNGATPEEAINNHWRIYTTLPKGNYAVARPYGNGEIRARWNGFMWEPVDDRT